MLADGVGELADVPAIGPPTKPPGPPAACWPGSPPRIVCAEGGGAPCLERENAFIFAWISEFSPLARLGSGPGRLAAFVGPSGAEEGLIAEAIFPVWKLKDGGLETDCGEVWGASGEGVDWESSGFLETSGEGGLSMVTKGVRLRGCAAAVFTG